MEELAQPKPFPWLFITSIIFLIGVALVGTIWIAAISVKQPAKTVTSPMPTIVQKATPMPTLTTQTATSYSSSGLYTFPTKQLTLTLPANWTTLEGSDTHQIANWWQPDYSMVITSPDTTTPPANCPEGGCFDYGATVTIIDYGASAFTTPAAWYEGKSSKDITTASSSGNMTVDQTVFASLPAYCVIPNGQNPLSETPKDLPSEIFGGTCYVVWRSHVYSISAVVNPNTATFQANLSQTASLLRSIKLVP
jgi:hypothetical protein